jgi:hypothetical protein
MIYALDGAVSCAAWLRARTRLENGPTTTLVTAARRLPQLPTLQAAFAEGAITYHHVTAVTRAAISRRMPAIALHEGTLVELARTRSPKQVRVALLRIRDVVDPDGTPDPHDPDPDVDLGDLDDDDETPGGPTGDERRELEFSRTIHGLWNLLGTLDFYTGELLATLLDAYMTADDPDTPEHLRRSASQRRHDALHAMLVALADSGVGPTRHGAKPHVLITIDLLSLIGLAQLATRPTTRTRFGGRATVALARQLLAEGAKHTAVAPMGPWRTVSFGSTRRTLPDWLRPVLHMTHLHCRGPDCDRPTTWTDAHHVIAWVNGKRTELHDTVPLCPLCGILHNQHYADSRIMWIGGRAGLVCAGERRLSV